MDMSRRSITGLVATIMVTAVLGALTYQAQTADVWFDDVEAPMDLSTQDGKVLVHAVGESLLHRTSTLNDIPVSLQEDRLPRVVFLSVSDGRSHARITIGAAHGLVPALEQAIARMQATLAVDFRPRWIKMDVVQTVRPTQEVYPDTRFGFERSLEGLAFEHQSGVAFLPGELVAHTLVDSDGDIRPGNIAQYLGARRPMPEQLVAFSKSKPRRVRRFTTSSFFYDGRQAIRLYRGHRLIRQISTEDLLTAARQAGAYLTRSVDPDGRFVYVYLPKSNRVPNRYNLIRHAGTVYSMLELYDVTQDTELLKASKRAIEYLLEFAKPWSEDHHSVAIVNSGGEVKLGATALTVVALAKYVEVTQDRPYIPVLQQLGRYIQQSQLENGEFISKRMHRSGEVSDFVSQYYPGEAVLALVRLYDLDPRDSWLDTAEKGSRYLINVRDQGRPTSELIHDHWLLYALNGLYRHRPKPLYLKHALRIAQSISQSQNRNPQYPDYAGSYYRPPRSTPTATRTEGLVAAYRLACDFGLTEEAHSILETIRLNVGFQLQTQFGPESVLYLEDPQRVLGGFHKSLTNFKIRNDYVQHNISSLLGTYQILTDEGWNTFPGVSSHD